MRTIAIIPARGGSRRLPGKNIKLFRGQPVIAYAIAAAREHGFDRIMTSTDSQEIADIARGFGTEVPFMRSERTAGDLAPTAEVLIEVLECYRERGEKFDLGCCIYPCNPFLTVDKLAQAKQTLERTRRDCVFAAVRYGHPVQRAFTIEQDCMSLLFPQHRDTRTQDLPVTLHDAAQFYWFSVPALLSERTLWTSNTSCIEVSELEAQDIDTADDWVLAELKYDRWKAGQG